MLVKKWLKTFIMKSALKRQKEKIVFDQTFAENYKLKQDSDESLFNSNYFTAHGFNGQSLIMRLTEYGEDKSEIWFAYRDEAGNDYICVHQYTQSDQTLINMQCVDVSKKWALQYNGGIIQGTQSPDNVWQKLRGIKIIPIVFEGEFLAAGAIFDFNGDMDIRPISRAYANEKLNKKLFEQIKTKDTVHYEQSGKIKGFINLGNKKINIDLPAIRDRSFGKSDLSNTNYHIKILTMNEDGETISIDIVQNNSVKQLQTGYIISNGETICLDSVIGIDEKQIREVPTKLNFLANFADGRKLVVRGRTETVFEFGLKDGDYKIYEGIGVFDINGKKTRGIMEFGYNRNYNLDK